MKCDKCTELAVATRELGFRSFTVKVPLCQKHLEEWDARTRRFEEIHRIIIRGGNIE